MSTYSIDSIAQALRATGIVEPVYEWVEDATGKRSQSNVQQTSEVTGLPLWSVEVQYVSESFGRQATVISRVTVGSATQPAPAAFELVAFEGLTVDVSVNRKTGALREYWGAFGIAAPAAQGRKSEAA